MQGVHLRAEVVGLTIDDCDFTFSTLDNVKAELKGHNMQRLELLWSPKECVLKEGVNLLKVC